ncbi:MAG: ROK family protein [Clostridiales bacterium]|nr:ROK family protein [Clostridiales bacterium]
MILGIDIGGTNVKFAVTDSALKPLFEKTIDTTVESDMALLASVAECALEIKCEYPYKSVGVGSPGIMDINKGIIIHAGKIPYNNTPVVAYLSERLGVPVYLGNDANCAALGELYAGFGGRYPNMLTVALGTGVGGGIIIGGKLYTGSDGSAGEFGHMTIKYDGLQCTCGRLGCYEQYASVTGLIQQTVEAAEAHPDSLLAAQPKPFTGRTSYAAMRAGCPVGKAVVETWYDYIAYGLDDLKWLFRPDAIVICGAIVKEGDDLLLPLRRRVPDVHIELSSLMSRAGVIGAAALALYH